MRSPIDIAAPSTKVASLLATLSLAGGVVDRSRLRNADLRAARQFGLSLRAHTGAHLHLPERDAEDLLAVCDAVFGALDTKRIQAPELALVVQEFCTFRVSLYLACSCAPSPAAVLQEAA